MIQNIAMTSVGLWLLVFLSAAVMAFVLPNNDLPMAIVQLSVFIPLALAIMGCMAMLLFLALFMVVAPWWPRKKTE